MWPVNCLLRVRILAKPVLELDPTKESEVVDGSRILICLIVLYDNKKHSFCAKEYNNKK
jgi:hypothetical protein